MPMPRLDPTVTEGKTPRITVPITEAIWNDVKTLARIRGVSGSHMIRVFTEMGIEEAKRRGELRIPKPRRERKPKTVMTTEENAA